MTTTPKPAGCLARVVGYTLLLIIVVAITVGVAVGAGSIVAAIAPNLGVSLFGPTLCPPDTTPTLITEYGPIYRDSDGDERQDVTQKIRCLDAQGAVSVGRGDQYETYWFGLWIVIFVALEALAVAVWLVVSTIARLRRASLPPAPAANNP